MSVEIGRLRKWGGSLVLTIPPAFIEQLRLNRDDYMSFRRAQGVLIIQRVPKEQLSRVKAGVVDGA